MPSMMRTSPPRQRRLAQLERQRVCTVDKAHGRFEVRSLTSTTQLDEEYLDFPDARQCFKLTRSRRLRDRETGELKTTIETAYGITSRPREQTDANALLKIVRAHWGIENRVFHVRDQTQGEDASRVRKKSAPIIFSTLRNCVLNVMRSCGTKNIAAQMRRFNSNPVKALHAIQRK
jgi:hypothetical protein